MPMTIEEFRQRLATRQLKLHDRYVGLSIEKTRDQRVMSKECTKVGELPSDGSTDGKSDPGSLEKGKRMAKELAERKTAEHLAMRRQDPTEIVKRALALTGNSGRENIDPKGGH